MLNRAKELEATLLKLDEINKKLEELSSQASLFGRYQVEFAKHFVLVKQGEKKPSDETAKQMVLAKPEMTELIEAYNAMKFQLEINVEISRALRKKIDSLRDAQNEETGFNKVFGQ